MIWPLLSVLSLLVLSSKAVELTFELPDNAKECFHEEIAAGIEATLEFQVSFWYKFGKNFFDQISNFLLIAAFIHIILFQIARLLLVVTMM